MDGVVREMNAVMQSDGFSPASEYLREWKISYLLLSDIGYQTDILGKLVTEFGRVCERRKLRVKVGKSKVMKCVRNPDGGRMTVRLNGKLLEEVENFRYLGVAYNSKWESGGGSWRQSERSK